MITLSSFRKTSFEIKKFKFDFFIIYLNHTKKNRLIGQLGYVILDFALVFIVLNAYYIIIKIYVNEFMFLNCVSKKLKMVIEV